MNNKISVVILTKDSQRFLPNCLDSILIQDYPYFEVIIVDSTSKDDTCDILKHYKTIYDTLKIPFKIIYVVSKTTIGAARQVGLEKSKGDIIAWVDSDVELPHENWLTNMVKPIKEDVCGTITLAKTRDNDPWILKHVHSKFEYKKEVIGIDNYQPVGTGHSLFKKDVIKQVGGFKDILTAEDLSLTKKMMEAGWKFVYMPSEKVYHYNVDGWCSFITKHLIRNKLWALRRIFIEGTKI